MPDKIIPCNLCGEAEPHHVHTCALNLKAKLDDYKRAVTDQLQYDMQSILSGTPEERSRLKIQDLVEALKFYANPETYIAIGFFPDRPCGDFIEDFEPVADSYTAVKIARPGKLARQVLRKLGEWNEEEGETEVENKPQ